MANGPAGLFRKASPLFLPLAAMFRPDPQLHHDGLQPHVLKEAKHCQSDMASSARVVIIC